VRDAGIGDFVTVGEMSFTSLAHCIRYSAPREKELSMCFNFHHLKVDYKDGDKWALQAVDYRRLKELFAEWQMGMQEGNGWNALFWCNHDQPRVVSRLGDEGRYWEQSAKMLAALIHLMRGTPYIFQGEEIGMTNPHYREISQYRDVESLNYYEILLEKGKSAKEALEVLAARSRDNGRSPMQWSGEANAGFTEGQPWIGTAENYRTINADSQMQAKDSVRAFYKELIALRKSRDTVSKGTIMFLEQDNPNVLAYKRTYGNEELVVLNNLVSVEAEILAEPVWEGCKKILGNYEESNINTGSIMLKPYETIVLEKRGHDNKALLIRD